MPQTRPTLTQLWESAKYLQWPSSHAKPSVRIPLPSGSFHTVSVTPREDELATFEACTTLRDQLGTTFWGKHRWEEILHVRTRSVAKHRQQRKGPMTGVHHEEPRQRGHAAKWVATWYEPAPGGTRRKRSRPFSYGTPNAAYATSEAAMQAAIRRRQDEERHWYSVLGEPGQRQANRR